MSGRVFTWVVQAETASAKPCGWEVQRRIAGCDQVQPDGVYVVIFFLSLVAAALKHNRSS